MAAEDVERLQEALHGCGGAGTGPNAEPQLVAARSRPALRAGAPARGEASPEDANAAALRTSAAVQLLASTRRIAEFASARQPSKEDRVVYACGSFDMFHVGHAEFLKDARALGTFLLVGIHDDLTISRAKGPNFPVMNLN